DTFVPSDRMAALRAALIAGDVVDGTIAAHAGDAGAAPVTAHRTAIDDCFSAESPQAILARLDKTAAQSDFAKKSAAAMRTKSPTSMHLAFQQIRRGAGVDFAEAMRMEFRIVSRVVQGHDFYEGVRAVIIDKDNAPRWQPATLDAVHAADIEAYFAPLGADELKV
ncbi:MAG: enoyl-CoA hydratase/isomerase family protein, partial [Beijerinckiaceae bacterium]